MLQHQERLHDCDVRLVALAQQVGRQRDVVVVFGARTVAQEVAAIASGHSHVTDPLDSKHVIDLPQRPLALAVDLGPVPLDWKDIPAFAQLAHDVKAAAVGLGLAITWGGDWGWDYDHYELRDP